MKHETQSVPDGTPPVDSVLLERPYAPPALLIFEEVELGGGYHTLNSCCAPEPRGWSEPYQKSGMAWYRSRVVRVPYPPAEGPEAAWWRCAAFLMTEEGERWISQHQCNRLLPPYSPPDPLSVTTARRVQAESILRCRDHGGTAFMVDCIDCHDGKPKVDR